MRADDVSDGPASIPHTRPTGFHGLFRTDFLARSVYSEGAGIGRVVPSAVAVPRDPDDVAELIRWAHAEGVAVVPRGSGSGMAGGAVGSGLMVDLSRLDQLQAVDPVRRRVWAGPGVTRARVQSAAREHGLRFPVDPSSGAFCTVGGMAATNAAGAHTLRLGATRSWVTALDCVFDDGSRATVRRGSPLPVDVPAIRRFLENVHDRVLTAPSRERSHIGVRKDSSGFALSDYARSGELVDLLIGSEGSLAIFVGLELALAPLPAATSSVLAEFGSLENAVDAASRARRAGASACELLDRTFLDFAAQAAGNIPVVHGASEAVLLVEVEAPDHASAVVAAAALEREFDSSGAVRVVLALDPVAEAALWSLRHAASPILARLDPALKSMQLIEDGAVPPERLPEYVRGTRAALVHRGVRGVIFGHAGDSHVHVNALIDVRLPDWRSRAAGLLDDVTGLVSRLGGTISGEHGDGRLRTPLLDRVWSPESMALFRDVKRAFDPRGILNPGVKVPEAGQTSLGDVKYDPALPPLPASAREALDSIERERAWSCFRLSLVGEAS